MFNHIWAFVIDMCDRCDALLIANHPLDVPLRPERPLEHVFLRLCPLHAGVRAWLADSYLADGAQEWYPPAGGRVGVFVEAAHLLHRWRRVPYICCAPRQLVVRQRSRVASSW